MATWDRWLNVGVDIFFLCFKTVFLGAMFVVLVLVVWVALVKLWDAISEEGSGE